MYRSVVSEDCLSAYISAVGVTYIYGVAFGVGGTKGAHDGSAVGVL
jgi:hypothetical protein